MIEILPVQPLVKTRKLTRKPMLVGITLSRWSLPLILLFQTLVCWTQLQNTAFQDEALYIYAGRQILQHWFGGLPLYDNYSYYFSGYPYVFPIIGGALDMIGGLELVRFFSMLCMLTVTTCGYYVAKKLFNQKSAIFAAIFFVCQGPVLFLSRLATYDPLCLCLLALGTALAVNAASARKPWRALGLGPLLVLAFGAKYAALLFIPSVLAILALCAWLKWKSGMVELVALATLSLAVVGTLAAIIVIHVDPSMLHAIGATTTNRVIIDKQPRMTLVIHIIQMVGLSYAVGLSGLVFARKQQLLIVFLFLGSALLIPGYHIYKAELISLDKHLGFSMFFVMPVAGYALASLANYRPILSSGRYWLATMTICLMLFLIGVGEARYMYLNWPSTTNLIYALNTQVRPANGRYLVEQYEVSRYYLKNDTYTWQWTGLDFFEYTDKQGHQYIGDEAYVKAIDAGYFDIIQLNYGYDMQTALLISRTIAQSKKYTLIDVIPYQDAYGGGHFWIWRKR